MIRRQLVALFLVAACDPFGSGISQTQAIEIASRASQLRQPVLVDIHQARLPDAQQGDDASSQRDPQDRAWVVTFSGTLEICRPAPGGCEFRTGTATVYLDYTSGAYLKRNASAP